MPQLAIGNMYSVNRTIDMRPHGVIPCGTTVQLLEHNEAMGYITARFTGASPLRDYFGDCVLAGDDVHALVPTKNTASTTLQHIAAALLCAVLIPNAPASAFTSNHRSVLPCHLSYYGTIKRP